MKNNPQNAVHAICKRLGLIALLLIAPVSADADCGAIRVIFPAQELEDGTVRLEVSENKIGRISIVGNRHYSEANIRAAVPSLVAGDYLRQDAVNAALALTNDSFAKHTRLTLVRSETPGQIDAQLSVRDQPPGAPWSAWTRSFQNSSSAFSPEGLLPQIRESIGGQLQPAVARNGIDTTLPSAPKRKRPASFLTGILQGV